MKISIPREELLKPLQITSSVVERRQTLPVLSNILLKVQDKNLILTGTDLEVEIVAKLQISEDLQGEVTLPARKFLDICRALPEDANINIQVDDNKAIIKSGRSRFSLATLPATEFPNIDPIVSSYTFSISQKEFKSIIEQTQFSMAQQDVRYYLNGLMLELNNNLIKAVATDGHRLAICEKPAELTVNEPLQVIIPRKGVTELSRLLEDSDSKVNVKVSENHIQVELNNVIFTSKLIDGKFPDYQQVIPSNPTKIVLCDRDALYQSFTRASVLSNEKYRGMRLQVTENMLKATVHNPEQEEAEEELEVNYQGDEFEIGFNVSYFIDALAAIKGEKVEVKFTDANQSCLLNESNDETCRYVIMPMRL